MPKKARKSCFLNSYTLPLLLLTTVQWFMQSVARIVDIRNDFVGPTYRIDYPSCVTSEKARNSSGGALA